MIREIRPEDASFIQEICKSSLNYDVDTTFVQKQIELTTKDTNHHYISVFEEEETNTVVGFVHAERYDCLYAESGLNVLGLAVLESFQGQGIGKRLMQQIESLATSQGFHFVRVNSGSYRTEAHKFYEKIGYTNTKLQVRFIKHLKE